MKPADFMQLLPLSQLIFRNHLKYKKVYEFLYPSHESNNNNLIKDKINLLHVLDRFHYLNSSVLNFLVNNNNILPSIITAVEYLNYSEGILGCLDSFLCLIKLQDSKQIEFLSQIFSILTKEKYQLKIHQLRHFFDLDGSSSLVILKKLLILTQQNKISFSEFLKDTLAKNNAALLKALIPNKSEVNNYDFFSFLLFNIQGKKDNQLHQLYPIMELLNQNNCLNITSLLGVYACIDPKALNQITAVLSEKKLLTPSIFQLLIPLLTKRNNKDITKLKRVIKELNKHSLLTSDAIETTLHKLTLKLPTLPITSYNKVSKQTNGDPMYHVIFRDSSEKETKIYVENKQQAKRDKFYFADMIRNGYASLDTNQPPSFVIRTDVNSFNFEKSAKKEMTYNHLFGREAYLIKIKSKSVYTAPKCQLFSPDLPGKSLNDFKPDEITSSSFEGRLKCLISALEDLNSLHNQYSVHGQIQPRNFKLDLKNEKMYLVNFFFANKNCSTTTDKTMIQKCHRDKTFQSHTWVQFCDDMYAMRSIVTTLFPELFDVQKDDGKIIIANKEKTFTPQEKSILNLVFSMSLKRTKRCNSDDALAYCKEILNSLSDLTEENLQKIADRTLYPVTPSVENIIRHPIHPDGNKATSTFRRIRS